MYLILFFAVLLLYFGEVIAEECEAEEYHCVCAVSSYFDIFGTRSRLSNLVEFAKSLERQEVKLILAHLSFSQNEAPLDVPESTYVIKREADASYILWQKEKLLNLAINDAFTRTRCKNIVWLDADVIFQDDEWHKKLCAALEINKIVRPFSKHSRGSKKHNGFGMSASLETLDRLNGLFEYGVVGGSDTLMAAAFNSTSLIDLEAMFATRLSPSLSLEFLKWAKTVINIVNGSIDNIEGEVISLDHGNIGKRQYNERHKILINGNFDPGEDLQTYNGIFRWNPAQKSAKKQIMRERVKQMFKRRGD